MTPRNVWTHHTGSRHVLLVQSPATCNTPFAAALASQGYDVTPAKAPPTVSRSARSTPATVDAFDSLRIDILLIDIGIDPTLEVELCRAARHANAGPIVVLCGHSDLEHVVALFDVGGDVVVPRTTPLAELVARVQAISRRTPPPTVDVTHVSPTVRVAPRTRRAFVGRTELALTRREFDLLATLVSSPGRVVSRHELLRRVWPGRNALEGSTLTVHVSVLRRKLREAGAGEDTIATVRGVGFRFTGSNCPPDNPTSPLPPRGLTPAVEKPPTR